MSDMKIDTNIRDMERKYMYIIMTLVLRCEWDGRWICLLGWM